MREEFDFISGRLCLDFANVWKNMQHPDPGLQYATLLQWSKQAGSLSAADLGRLAQRASREAAKVAVVVDRAHDLAATLRRFFMAIVEEKRPNTADLDLLNTELARAWGRLSVVQQDGAFALDWPATSDALDRLIWPVAHSAADLLVSADLDRLKACDADNCIYLFVDSSKSGRRRWCDMKICGNRHKARRHREKLRAKTG